MKSTVTEHGELSIPDEVRREMHLAAGSTVLWESVSPTECRLVVELQPAVKPDPVAAIGFAKRHGLPQFTTAEWMKMVREDR